MKFSFFSILNITFLLFLFIGQPLNNSTFQKETITQNDANGTISGKVIYEGGAIRTPMKIIKDERTCGNKPVINESLLTSADGGLNWAVVSIASEIKGGKSLDQLPGDRTLNQKTCVYEPHVVLVGVNESLTINNLDHTLHNVRTVSFMNDAVNKVQIYIPNSPAPSDKVVFTEPEVVEVICDVHGWMKAYVHVVDNAYNSITNDNGEFTMTDVPPGKYKLKVWHEKLGELEQDVTVTAGQTTEVIFSYKKAKQ